MQREVRVPDARELVLRRRRMRFNPMHQMNRARANTKNILVTQVKPARRSMSLAAQQRARTSCEYALSPTSSMSRPFPIAASFFIAWIPPVGIRIDAFRIFSMYFRSTLHMSARAPTSEKTHARIRPRPPPRARAQSQSFVLIHVRRRRTVVPVARKSRNNVLLAIPQAREWSHPHSLARGARTHGVKRVRLRPVRHHRAQRLLELAAHYSAAQHPTAEPRKTRDPACGATAPRQRACLKASWQSVSKT